MQSRDTDMITVLRDLLLDLLITGYAFYRVLPTVENNNIRI
nr:MAG TPA: chalcone isomerase [Bacteriophage sp.]DAU17998.1 MAG TPA: chalcone isomerase [Bacteriophage sp.]